MKNNEQIVLDVVQRSGCNLSYASDELKNKESIVLAAMKESLGALDYAS